MVSLHYLDLYIPLCALFYGVMGLSLSFFINRKSNTYPFLKPSFEKYKKKNLAALKKDLLNFLCYTQKKFENKYYKLWLSLNVLIGALWTLQNFLY